MEKGEDATFYLMAVVVAAGMAFLYKWYEAKRAAILAQQPSALGQAVAAVKAVAEKIGDEAKGVGSASGSLVGAPPAVAGSIARTETMIGSTALGAIESAPSSLYHGLTGLFS